MADSFQSQIPVKPDQILEILIRRKWFIIIPLCISLTIGLFHTLTTEKTYEASTLILVQPQRVPTNYIRSVVTSTISQRISTISQQILSRSNLEKIIDQFGLFENAEGMYLEDKIYSMRKRVKVKIERTRRSGAEAFSIVFTGSEPQRVMRVANTLASFFMDENLKVREAQAIGTSEFLDSELEKTRNRLEEREKQLADYRKKYLGGLPDELETNLRTLDRLQLEINGQRELLRETKNSINILETRIARVKENNSQESDLGFQKSGLENGDGVAPEQSENQQKLELAEKQLETLLLTYTEKHPDVLKLKKAIEKLETTNQEEEKTDQEEVVEEKTQKVAESLNTNSEILQKELQVRQMKDEFNRIQSDISKMEQQMKVYQKRVEDTPKREIEMQSLQRDYSNIQNVFNSLLDRKLEAELSVNMEKKQKGEQFRILDHARLPEKPISPDVKKLFFLAVVSGLGLAAGIIFLLEFFDTSIRREEQIEKELGLKILAAVPTIKRANDKLKKRIGLILFGCLTIYAIMFLSFFAVLNSKGLDRTINFIKHTLL